MASLCAGKPDRSDFMNFPHIAYAVDELEPHLEGKDIYLAPFDVGDPRLRASPSLERTVSSSNT